MAIHIDYARLTAADRAVADRAFEAVADVMREHGRKADNADRAERLAEAIATFMITSGGAARMGEKPNLTARPGAIHESYGS